MTENHLTCRDLIEFLGEYIDQTLPETTRAEFEAHLRLCSECRAYLDAYAKTIALSRKSRGDAKVEPMPASLIDAIKKARRE